MQLSSDDVNSLLDIIQEFKNPFSKSYTINKNDIVNYFQNFDCDEDEFDYLYLLDGYKVSVKEDGEHKTDGQLVDYTFTFTSPEGKKSVLQTEMCLMIGWNYWEEFELL